MSLGLTEEKPGLCMPSTRCPVCGQPKEPLTPEQELGMAIISSYEMVMQSVTTAEIEELRSILQ